MDRWRSFEGRLQTGKGRESRWGSTGAARLPRQRAGGAGGGEWAGAGPVRRRVRAGLCTPLKRQPPIKGLNGVAII